jgi:hypothetical protein
MAAGNAFLMDFLKRSAEASAPKMVLGPDEKGEEMEKAPKRKGEKKAEKKPKCDSEVIERIRDEKWNRAMIMEHLRSLM